jgi:hypothetical protein
MEIVHPYPTKEHPMRFISFYTPANAGPPDAEHMAAMNKLVADMTASGSLVATGAMIGENISVRLANGDFTVKKGVAAASKEIGFAILEAQSPDHVIELTKTFLKVAGEGESFVRPLLGQPPK